MTEEFFKREAELSEKKESLDRDIQKLVDMHKVLQGAMKELPQDFGSEEILRKYENSLVKAGEQILLIYYKSEYKKKVTDTYIENEKTGNAKDRSLYRSYIEDIDRADTFNKVLDVYLEAYDLINSRTPDTPWSKKK